MPHGLIRCSTAHYDQILLRYSLERYSPEKPQNFNPTTVPDNKEKINAVERVFMQLVKLFTPGF